MPMPEPCRSAAPPRQVWLVRHGSRRDFVDPDWARAAARPEDPPLSEDGQLQARETAARLAREAIHHVFSSPFRRSVETAVPIARALGRRVCIEPGLAEWHNVEWFPVAPRAASAAALAREFPVIDPAHRSAAQPPYPETELEMFARTARTIRGLLAGTTGNLLLIGHGASVIGVTTALLGTRPEELYTTFCSIVRLEQRRPDRWILAADGRDQSHLSRPDPGMRPA